MNFPHAALCHAEVASFFNDYPYLERAIDVLKASVDRAEQDAESKFYLGLHKKWISANHDARNALIGTWLTTGHDKDFLPAPANNNEIDTDDYAVMSMGMGA